MVFGDIPRRRLIALTITAAILAIVSLNGALHVITPTTIVRADEPVILMVQVQPGVDIAQLSAEYQLLILDSIPALATHLVQATQNTADLLAAEPRVIDVHINTELSTFGAHHRNPTSSDVEALQRYFGFGNGDGDDNGDTLEGKPPKMKKPKNIARVYGAPEEVLALMGIQSFAPGWSDWGLRKINVEKAREYATGMGVTVAVLDTGADLDHPILVDHLVTGYDFVDNDDWPNDEPNGMDEDEDGVTDEGAGHGTHVATIVASIAPGVEIIPVRVLNSDGGGTLFDILQGIVYAVDHNADIINMSFSAVDDSVFLAAAVEYARAHDVLLIAAAAGADGYLEFPAAYESVVAVGSSQIQDYVSGFTQAYASEVDLFAPGEYIYSAYFNGGTAWWTGTSMAAPFVAGGAALMKDYCQCSSDLIANALMDKVKKVRPKYEHRGRLDLEKAIKELKSAWEPCDDEKPQVLTFQYTADACYASINRQGDKFTCSGEPGVGPVPIAITKDADKLFASPAVVNRGDLIRITTKEDSLKSELQLSIGGQKMKIQTSCSEPLEIGDRYGSLRLVAFIPKGAIIGSTGRGEDEGVQTLYLPLITR